MIFALLPSSSTVFIEPPALNLEASVFNFERVSSFELSCSIFFCLVSLTFICLISTANQNPKKNCDCNNCFFHFSIFLLDNNKLFKWHTTVCKITNEFQSSRHENRCGIHWQYFELPVFHDIGFDSKVTSKINIRSCFLNKKT